MFVEVHVLQNFALSNLNRDDTGAPKDCEFGGYRRARVSSQCIKRSIRTYFREHALLSAQNLSVRTKHLVKELAGRMVAQGRPEVEALPVARAALACISLKVKEKDKSEFLLLVGNGEIDAMTSVCTRYWSELLAMGQSLASEGAVEAAASTEKGKKPKKEPVPPEHRAMVTDMLNCLNGGEAVDLALFGRMIANKPEKNVDAATQVAHAISTNRVNMEFDFYTAVDDIPDHDPDAGAGAGMMGTVQYNSSCYYRYTNLDLRQLLRNLDGNEDLARSAVKAFLEANALTIPTGKQTGAAAQNPPSFVMVVVRKSGLWSLANAFVKPVHPNRENDLVSNSVAELVKYWSKLEEAYGGEEILYKGVLCLEDGVALNGLKQVGSLNGLITDVTSQVQFAAS